MTLPPAPLIPSPFGDHFHRYCDGDSEAPDPQKAARRKDSGDDSFIGQTAPSSTTSTSSSCTSAFPHSEVSSTALVAVPSTFPSASATHSPSHLPKKKKKLGSFHHLFTADCFSSASPLTSSSTWSDAPLQVVDLHQLVPTVSSRSSTTASTEAAASTRSSSGPSRITDFIYVGAVEDAQDADFLSSHNITTIINISSEVYWCPVESVSVHSFAVEDQAEADIRSLFQPTRAILDGVRAAHFECRSAAAASGSGRVGEASSALHSAAAEPPCVLVHCRKGFSRSPTIVAAYLMYRNGWTAAQAVRFVQQRRRAAEPNIGFLHTLRMFQDEMMPEERRIQRSRLLSVVVSNITEAQDEDEVKKFFETHVGDVRDVVIRKKDPQEHETRSISITSLSSSVSARGHHHHHHPTHQQNLPSHYPLSSSSSSSSYADSSDGGSAALTLALVHFTCAENVKLSETLAASQPLLFRSSLGETKMIRVRASYKLRRC